MQHVLTVHGHLNDDDHRQDRPLFRSRPCVRELVHHFLLLQLMFAVISITPPLPLFVLCNFAFGHFAIRKLIRATLFARSSPRTGYVVDRRRLTRPIARYWRGHVRK